MPQHVCRPTGLAARMIRIERIALTRRQPCRGSIMQNPQPR
jgi:hypothetical protein